VSGTEALPEGSVVAIYGGSFNPPHVGHGLVASWVLWTGQADALWLLPSHSHPFDKRSAPFERRVAMCEALAALLGPRVSVCSIEAELPPPHYTFEVRTELAARHPTLRFRLVAGADVVDDLPRWHRWEDLAARFDPLIVGRQGYPTPPGSLDMPGVSSTAIRDALARGESVAHLVPAPVLPLTRGLYEEAT
jgi:nicotinate-nucleotide adenylyltransferase